MNFPRGAAAASRIKPRLMVPGACTGRLDLAEERDLGAHIDRDLSGLIDQLAAASLRGRGGAGFPAHIKWRTVAAAQSSAVVANGEEGEPASFKDRWLMLHRPHLVLEGLVLAARVCRARRAIVYVSHAPAARSMADAIGELRDSGLRLPVERIELFEVAPRYVAGEETSVCRAINGGPALPTSKPPRPYQSGVDGLPTLVSNVETLAHAAWIARCGIEAYRQYGTGDSPGTTLVTLGGDCGTPGVYEVPYGMSIADAFTELGGGVQGTARALLAGGWFGGVLSSAALDLPISFEALQDAGSALGCTAFTVIGEQSDPVSVVAEVATWYARETAGQCGICVKGTQAIADGLSSLRDGGAGPQVRQNLHRWGTSLRGRGACALLDGAANLARTTYTNLIHDKSPGVQ